MQANVENLGQLQRRLNMMVPLDKIDNEVENRLKRLARSVKLHGFRPGKVPFKIVVQQYGPQVLQEVLGDALQKSFSEAVREQNLRVAGYPKFEAKTAQAGGQQFEYTATFEVYPEVKVGEVNRAAITRPLVEIGDAQVEKTLEILRKQRAAYQTVGREARERDQVTIDFHGKIGEEDFPGGQGTNLATVLGDKRLLPDFEKKIAGMRANETKTFELTFPADYHGKEVAGKTAVFELVLKRVAEPKLPEVDAEFARSLGIADGDLEKLKREIRDNLQKEAGNRIQARIKDQAMQALLDGTQVDLPQSLVEMEVHRLMDNARRDLEARGVKTRDLQLPHDLFETQAKRRVALGLIISELAKLHDLHPKPEQVRARVDEHVQSYEHPEQVVKWYYSEPGRLNDVEALVLEDNVVAWVMNRTKVAEKAMSFDELMGNANDAKS
ncbi:MAG TPA: trigger factor [Burkholderiales bacterium]|nr:trigger factor [Burkholderiales bacterium]